jgi:uncharacterized membrane protein
VLDHLNHWLKEQTRMLSNTFWFIPAIISLGGPVLAFAMLLLDDKLDKEVQEPYLFHGGVSAASTLLSTIAGSLITVAGLAFSVTIVALQLVSSQYTPRALRGFLQDRVTQIIAGGFFAIFSYALIVLANLHDGLNPALNVQFSITFAIVLGFFGLALLLLFIHHTGRIIQVADIAARIAEQTLRAIKQQNNEDIPKHPLPALTRQIQTVSTQRESGHIYAYRVGYVQRIELAHLVTDIMQPHVHLRLLVSPGDFVSEETLIAEVWPMHMIASTQQALQRHVIIERERDIDYDAKFGVRQLADIALRALSPAVNDPTTAVLCIKYLQAIFELLIQQTQLPTLYHFMQGTSTLTVRRPALQEYIRMLGEIAHYAGGNIRVINTLLRVMINLSGIVAKLHEHELNHLLHTVSSTIVEQALNQDLLEHDRMHIQAQCQKIEALLAEKPDSSPVI